MPPTANDGTLELDHDGQNHGDDEMGAAVPSEIAQQNLARLAQAGVQAHENFVKFDKILDYAYEADRKMVSLVESLGVREVTSASGHEGIPKAGAAADGAG